MLQYHPINVIKIPVSGAAQALAFAADGASVCYDVTLSANCTFTFTGGLLGIRQTISLLIREPGTFTVTITGVKWHNNATPTFTTTANTVIDLSFVTTDGGTTIIAK